MGWISERHAKRGGSLNPNPSQQKRGPLRKIIEVLRISESMFGPDKVLLECGHTATSWGGRRARCTECSLVP